MQLKLKIQNRLNPNYSKIEQHQGEKALHRM